MISYKKHLANLTEAQRVAFMMNSVEGKRFKEIAELLEISTKAVEKRIYGALRKRKDWSCDEMILRMLDLDIRCQMLDVRC